MAVIGGRVDRRPCLPTDRGQDAAGSDDTRSEEDETGVRAVSMARSAYWSGLVHPMRRDVFAQPLSRASRRSRRSVSTEGPTSCSPHLRADMVVLGPGSRRDDVVDVRRMHASTSASRDHDPPAVADTCNMPNSLVSEAITALNQPHQRPLPTATDAIRARRLSWFDY